MSNLKSCFLHIDVKTDIWNQTTSCWMITSISGFDLIRTFTYTQLESFHKILYMQTSNIFSSVSSACSVSFNNDLTIDITHPPLGLLMIRCVHSFTFISPVYLPPEIFFFIYSYKMKCIHVLITIGYLSYLCKYFPIKMIHMTVCKYIHNSLPWTIQVLSPSPQL